ncbi:hypothetical protein [Rosenbergiella collisarenosi]|uniref:hypothetical protein n=1 Tax=Rosenbergiella collisarenosi TaxID=1544695 RepID=UPI001F503019|nr:hypothetical protein [Rosenbergiella collisarenosi]
MAEQMKYAGKTLKVNDFISAYGDGFAEVFRSRYEFYFSPKLWETTAYEFPMTVRQIASKR